MDFRSIITGGFTGKGPNIMTMRVPKQKVSVKIKTETAVIIGTVHTMINGRLSDYIVSHVGKFIPVTDAEIYYLADARNNSKADTVKRDVIFVNVEKVEIIEYL